LTTKAPKSVGDDIRHCRQQRWWPHQAVPPPASQPVQQERMLYATASLRYEDFLRHVPKYVLRASLLSFSCVAWLLQTFISVVWFIFPLRQALM
jgi:hypothetical protein